MKLRISALTLTGCLLMAGCSGTSVAAAAISPAPEELQPGKTGAAAASEPEPPLPRGPVLTPEQVWDKLLAMIDAIGQREDLNRENIERAIGLKLYKRPGEAFSDRLVGDTTAGWSYVFDLSQYTEDDVRMAVRPFRPDAAFGVGNSPTCTWRTEKLRAALRERGFEEANRTVRGRNYFNWQYTRGAMVVRVRYYFDQEHLDYNSTCVDSVLVSFVRPEFYKDATWMDRYSADFMPVPYACTTATSMESPIAT
ncbi:MAG: hypothetical protein GXY33_20295 [Phycisphaerae bacterium]|nr:hypothetical protein [Phycisphaerae bacterium]